MNASEASNSSAVGGDTTNPSTPLTSLGTALRQARERQGLSAAALAAQLRMGEEQLQALESGDPQRLPELVFVIAQARRIGDALAIDVSPLVTLLKQQSNTVKPTPTVPSRGVGPVRWLGSLSLLAGVISAGIGAWQRAPQILEARLPKPSTKPVSNATPPTPSAKPAPAELTISTEQGSWLTVRTLAGKVLFEGLFKGTRQFPLAEGLEVLAGRPDLLLVSQGNIPGKPLGRIDQIRWISFSAPPR